MYQDKFIVPLQCKIDAMQSRFIVFITSFNGHVWTRIDDPTEEHRKIAQLRKRTDKYVYAINVRPKKIVVTA